MGSSQSQKDQATSKMDAGMKRDSLVAGERRKQPPAVRPGGDHSPDGDQRPSECSAEEEGSEHDSPRAGAPVLGHGDSAYGRTEYQEGPEVSFNVILTCTGEKTSVGKTLRIEQGMPLKVKDLKSCIESAYSIPVCCQSLVFESMTMDDRHLLEFYHVRDGDTISVSYASGGDVKDILDVVDYMTLYTIC